MTVDERLEKAGTWFCTWCKEQSNIKISVCENCGCDIIFANYELSQADIDCILKEQYEAGAKAQRDYTFYHEIEVMSESANLRLYDKPEDLELITQI